MILNPIIDRLKRIADLLPTAIGGGGIFHTGTKTITVTQNGTVTEDVTSYANAEVITNVPQGVFPTGTKTITVTQNGTVTENVTNYANAEVITNVPNDITDSLRTLGFTIVSDSIVTGTRNTGSLLVAFSDMGINAGESVIAIAIDTPTLNQAIIKLTGTYGGTYRAASVLRYPNEYRDGVSGDINAFLETDKKYRVIIFKP